MTAFESATATPSPSAVHRGPAALGAWCARRYRVVIGSWLILLVAATLGHTALGGAYSDDFSLPGTPSQQGADLLKAHQPAAGGQSGQLVFTLAGAQLSTERGPIEQAASGVARLPHVLSVSDPLSAASTSTDGHTAFATVHFDTNPTKLGSGYVPVVDATTATARTAGVHVDYGGVLGQAARPEANDRRSELIGIVVAILVLLLGFGSVYAAGLPIVSALLGVVTGLGVLGMLAAAITFGSVSPTLAIMMGLGVGIDYALFLTTRHRQQVMDGVDPVEASAWTVATSGRAIIVAAVTVVIAMLGLYASGLVFIGALGLAAAVGVSVSACAALTLVPALLGAAGARIDRFRVRRPVAESSSRGDGGGWYRYAEQLGRHPWRYLGAAVALLVVLALPVLTMRLGHVDAGADPSSYTDRRAYDAISAGFGPGSNGPFTVVVDLPSTTGTHAQTLGASLASSLRATAGVASVGPVKASPDGALLFTTVVPTTGPQDAGTDTLMNTLRGHVLPEALSPVGATGYVTGTTAAQLDFRDQVTDRLPTIITVVIVAAFVLLLTAFRSPVLAAKAAVLNLLSIGAASGVVVAVFQWGWGGAALGVGEKVPVESYVPMMMFAIVFGLSMDYEVFLLSRVRESWLQTHDNHLSVAAGLAATARVISCAALIMTSVFLAFALSTNVVIKMLALGLGVSVLIDATIIRLLVVPSTMFLLQRANWWIPAWLDTVLPHLDPEPFQDRGPALGPDLAAGTESLRAWEQTRAT